MTKFAKNFNWKNSPAHINFLIRYFTGPNNVDQVMSSNYLSSELKESHKSAVKRFIEDNSLINCGLEESLSVILTVHDLKKILSENKLKKSGSKYELIERLINYDHLIATNLVSNYKIMKCSLEATIFLDNYKKNREIALNSAQEKSYEFLLKNYIDDAIKEFISYKNNYTTDRYETNSITSWHLYVEMINYIISSSPKVLGSISNSNLSNLRAAVCMSILWVNELPESWLPDDFETTLSNNAVAINYLKCNARIKRDLDNCQQHSQKVKLVFDKFDLDSCESCKKLKNKIFYIKDFPELPLESCTSQTGCKCEIEEFYDEIGKAEEEERIHNYIMKVVSSRKDEFNEPYVLEKLKALKNFFDDNLITEEEFKQKRAEIIQKYF